MKKCISIFLSVIFCVWYTSISIHAHSGLAGIEKKHSNITNIDIPGAKKIRVLLESCNAIEQSKFLIKSQQGFVLESPVDSGTTALYQEKELRLLCKNKKLYFKCRDNHYRRIKQNNIEISTPHNKFSFNGTTYQGSLIVQIDDYNKTLIINRLNLDDYVYSVIRYESIPSWPLGMQKIQAIISRTYAVALMQKARDNTKETFFDIKNTNLHQVYNGSHGYTHLRQAIDETKDMILTHKHDIALTMFDICCGGTQPSLMHDRDVSKPYLCRSKKCTFCVDSPSFKWKEDMHVATFLEKLRQKPLLQNKFTKFGKSFADIKIVSTDKAGVVQKVKLYDKQGHCVTLTGNDIRAAFVHKIKSRAFSLKKIRDRIVVTGKGYGHQKGLCQWGAKNMVDRGWSTKSILHFYYPGTQLRRLV